MDCKYYHDLLFKSKKGLYNSEEIKKSLLINSQFVRNMEGAFIGLTGGLLFSLLFFRIKSRIAVIYCFINLY